MTTTGSPACGFTTSAMAPIAIVHVVRRSRARIVLDVNNGTAGIAKPVEQPLALNERRLDALELHQALAIGILAINEDQRRLADRSGHMP